MNKLNSSQNRIWYYTKRYFIPATAIAITGFAAFRVLKSPHASVHNHPSHYDHQIHTMHKPIPTSEIPSREKQIERLKSDEIFDVLVIGGGCVGSGVALDAISRGLSVALVEKDDFASGTSSRSTKLIHGGVRYLEKAFKNLDYKQLNLVVEALNERRHLISITPHLSYEIPIIVPIYHRYPEALFYLPYYWIGMKMYDFFAGSDGLLRSSYFMNKRNCLEKFPMLNDRGLKGAIVYYDGMHNDARMSLSIVLTAAAKGASIANHVEMVKLLKDESGKVCGATLQDKLTKDVWDVRCKVAVNASGYFCDETRKRDDLSVDNMTTPSSGTHIVLPDHYSPKRMGMLIPNTDDGRVIFLLPWEGSTIAGTTDSECDVVNLPRPKKSEAEFIVKEVGRYLSTDLQLSDIDACWTGIRPLARDPNSKDTQSISRDHVIHTSDSGLITITGGKWTTYRKMAEDVVDCILKNNEYLKNGKEIKDCHTTLIPLIGASGWSLSVAPELVRRGYDLEIAEHLSHNYGFLAFEVAEIGLDGFNKRLATGYPFIEAEVLFGSRHEYAVNTVDVISRRLRLAFLNSAATFEALPRVISLLGNENNWDCDKRIKEYKNACDYLSTMHIGINNKKRHLWHLREPSHASFDRIETLFGVSPLKIKQIEHLKQIFTSLKIDSNSEKISCENANSVIRDFANKNRSFSKIVPQLFQEVNQRENNEIFWEDFLFSICSVALSNGKK